MTSQPPEPVGQRLPDFSNLPCNKLGDAKAIVELYLGNGFTRSYAGTAAVGGSMQTGVAGDS